MDKLSKKDLRTPDQIWQASRTTMTWMTDRAVPLIVALCLAIAALIGGLYYSQIRLKKEAEADYYYGQAKAHFEQWKLQATDSPAAKETKAAGGDRAKSEADLKTALETLTNDFPNSKANGLANLVRAQFALENKQTKEAVQFLESFAKALPSNDVVLAHYPLALALEEVGDWTRAVETYDKVVKAKKPGYEQLGLLGKARALRMAQKPEEAASVYREFLEKFQTSQEAPQARGLLAETLESIKKN